MTITIQSGGAASAVFAVRCMNERMISVRVLSIVAASSHTLQPVKRQLGGLEKLYIYNTSSSSGGWYILPWVMQEDIVLGVVCSTVTHCCLSNNCLATAHGRICLENTVPTTNKNLTRQQQIVRAFFLVFQSILTYIIRDFLAYPNARLNIPPLYLYKIGLMWPPKKTTVHYTAVISSPSTRLLFNLLRIAVQ